MKNTVSGNEARGFMKIIVDADSDRVVGMHMIGPDCAEIMQVRSVLQFLLLWLGLSRTGSNADGRGSWGRCVQKNTWRAEQSRTGCEPCLNHCYRLKIWCCYLIASAAASSNSFWRPA